MAHPIGQRQLNTEEKAVIGSLLVEILASEIQQQTWDALYKLGPIYDTEPYGHLVRYAQGYARDGKSLAHDLQDELRIICVELLDPNYPPAE